MPSPQEPTLLTGLACTPRSHFLSLNMLCCFRKTLGTLGAVCGLGRSGVLFCVPPQPAEYWIFMFLFEIWKVPRNPHHSLSGKTTWSPRCALPGRRWVACYMCLCWLCMLWLYMNELIPSLFFCGSPFHSYEMCSNYCMSWYGTLPHHNQTFFSSPHWSFFSTPT